MSRKCSLEPQFHKAFRSAEKPGWWYYEQISGIEVYVDAQSIRTACNEGHGYNFKIPRKMLEQSLRRMRASRSPK